MLLSARWRLVLLEYQRVIRFRVGDAERHLAIQQVGQQITANVGTPTSCNAWRRVALLAKHMPADQLS